MENYPFVDDFRIKNGFISSSLGKHPFPGHRMVLLDLTHHFAPIYQEWLLLMLSGAGLPWFTHTFAR
jgi:hypothetical protein